MQYKPIENCEMENAILGKDFNLGAISFLFHIFTHVYHILPNWLHLTIIST